MNLSKLDNMTTTDLEVAAITKRIWSDSTSLDLNPDLTYKDTNDIAGAIKAFDVEKAVNKFAPEVDKSELLAAITSTDDSNLMRESFIGVLASAYASLIKPIHSVGNDIPLPLGFETKKDLAKHIESNADNALMIALRESSLAHAIPVKLHLSLRKTMTDFLIAEAKMVEYGNNLSSIHSR